MIVEEKPQTNARRRFGERGSPEHRRGLSESLSASPAFQAAKDAGTMGNPARADRALIDLIVSLRERRPAMSWGKICEELEVRQIPTVQGGVKWHRSAVKYIYDHRRDDDQ